MAAKYELVPDRRVVKLTYSGSVTGQEISDMYKLLAADKRIDESWSTLADAAEVTDADFSLASIRTVLDSIKSNRLTLRPSAIVARTDFIFGLARIYQALAEFVGGRVGVFRTLDEAERWLEATTDETSHPGD